jgi:hypothetical protein
LRSIATKHHQVQEERVTKVRKIVAVCGALCALAIFQGTLGRPAAAQEQQQQSSYTPAEYNDFTAARTETDPQKRIADLDAFTAKYPSSTLLPYVYTLEYQTYGQLKNFPKSVEYADKLLALPKLDSTTQLTALYARAQAFYLGAADKALNTPDQLAAARKAAQAGIQAANTWAKPDNMTDDQLAAQKKAARILFNTVDAIAALQLKDYSGAVAPLKATLADQPTDGLTWYRLGVALLQQNPPQTLDGLWAVARAIDLKAPNDAQIRDYLGKRVMEYEQAACDSITDAQIKELLDLAQSADQRPATFTIPSSADLDKARQQAGTFLHDLQTGGDNAKLVWAAFCGSDFPAIPAKVLAVTPGADAVELQVYIISQGETDAQVTAATTANGDVKVVGQPEASRLAKDDVLEFAGTLVSYDPTPFMLHFDKGKVNPDYIPAVKGGATKKHPHS